MLDIRDVLVEKSNATMQGVYYARRPKAPEDVGQRFVYEKVDPEERTYRMVFANILGDATGTTTIKTRIALDFQKNSFVVLKDGTMYSIIAVGKDESSVKSRQAFRHMKNAAGTEFYLRLVEVDNPWGVS